MIKKLILASFFLLFGLNSNAQVSNSGLIRFYPFIGTAYDFSGNNSHGTVIGATLTSDRFGHERINPSKLNNPQPR